MRCNMHDVKCVNLCRSVKKSSVESCVMKGNKICDCKLNMCILLSAIAALCLQNFSKRFFHSQIYVNFLKNDVDIRCIPSADARFARE